MAKLNISDEVRAKLESNAKIIDQQQQDVSARQEALKNGQDIGTANNLYGAEALVEAATAAANTASSENKASVYSHSDTNAKGNNKESNTAKATANVTGNKTTDAKTAVQKTTEDATTKTNSLWESIKESVNKWFNDFQSNVSNEKTEYDWASEAQNYDTTDGISTAKAAQEAALKEKEEYQQALKDEFNGVEGADASQTAYAKDAKKYGAAFSLDVQAATSAKNNAEVKEKMIPLAQAYQNVDLDNYTSEISDLISKSDWTTDDLALAKTLVNVYNGGKWYQISQKATNGYMGTHDPSTSSSYQMLNMMNQLNMKIHSNISGAFMGIAKAIGADAVEAFVNNNLVPDDVKSRMSELNANPYENYERTKQETEGSTAYNAGSTVGTLLMMSNIASITEAAGTGIASVTNSAGTKALARVFGKAAPAISAVVNNAAKSAISFMGSEAIANAGDIQRGTHYDASSGKSFPQNEDGSYTFGTPNYGKGNINLNRRGIVLNDDGSYSTIYSISFEEDGKEVLVPSVIYKDGEWKRVSAEEAIQHYKETGEYLGKFDTVEEADTYAQKIHDDGDKLYGDFANSLRNGSSAYASYSEKEYVRDILSSGGAGALGGALSTVAALGVNAASKLISDKAIYDAAKSIGIDKLFSTQSLAANNLTGDGVKETILVGYAQLIAKTPILSQLKTIKDIAAAVSFITSSASFGIGSFGGRKIVSDLYSEANGLEKDEVTSSQLAQEVITSVLFSILNLGLSKISTSAVNKYIDMTNTETPINAADIPIGAEHQDGETGTPDTTALIKNAVNSYENNDFAGFTEAVQEIRTVASTTKASENIAEAIEALDSGIGWDVKTDENGHITGMTRSTDLTLEESANIVNQIIAQAKVETKQTATDAKVNNILVDAMQSKGVINQKNNAPTEAPVTTSTSSSTTNVETSKPKANKRTPEERAAAAERTYASERQTLETLSPERQGYLKQTFEDDIGSIDKVHNGNRVLDEDGNVIGRISKTEGANSGITFIGENAYDGRAEYILNDTYTDGLLHNLLEDGATIVDANGNTEIGTMSLFYDSRSEGQGALLESSGKTNPLSTETSAEAVKQGESEELTSASKTPTNNAIIDNTDILGGNNNERIPEVTGAREGAGNERVSKEIPEQEGRPTQEDAIRYNSEGNNSSEGIQTLIDSKYDFPEGTALSTPSKTASELNEKLKSAEKVREVVFSAVNKALDEFGRDGVVSKAVIKIALDRKYPKSHVYYADISDDANTIAKNSTSSKLTVIPNHSGLSAIVVGKVSTLEDAAKIDQRFNSAISKVNTLEISGVKIIPLITPYVIEARSDNGTVSISKSLGVMCDHNDSDNSYVITASTYEMVIHEIDHICNSIYKKNESLKIAERLDRGEITDKQADELSSGIDKKFNEDIDVTLDISLNNIADFIKSEAGTDPNTFKDAMYKGLDIYDENQKPDEIISELASCIEEGTVSDRMVMGVSYTDLAKEMWKNSQIFRDTINLLNLGPDSLRANEEYNKPITQKEEISEYNRNNLLDSGEGLPISEENGADIPKSIDEENDLFATLADRDNEKIVTKEEQSADPRINADMIASDNQSPNIVDTNVDDVVKNENANETRLAEEALPGETVPNNEKPDVITPEDVAEEEAHNVAANGIQDIDSAEKAPTNQEDNIGKTNISNLGQFHKMITDDDYKALQKEVNKFTHDLNDKLLKMSPKNHVEAKFVKTLADVAKSLIFNSEPKDIQGSAPKTQKIELDSNGNPVLDADGNPVTEVTDETNSVGIFGDNTAKKIWNVYQDLINSPTYSKWQDPALEETWKNVQREIGHVALQDMTYDQMNTLLNFMKQVRHTLTDSKYYAVDNEKATIADEFNKLAKESDDASASKDGGLTLKGKFRDRFIAQELRGTDLLEAIGGYVKGSAWGKVAESFNKGQNTAYKTLFEGLDILKSTFGKDLSKARKQMSQTVKITVPVLDDISGKDSSKEIEMSVGMAYDLFMALQNDAGARRILLGGINIPDAKDFYNGKTSEGQNITFISPREKELLQEHYDDATQLRRDIQSALDDGDIESANKLRESLRKLNVVIDDIQRPRAEKIEQAVASVLGRADIPTVARKIMQWSANLQNDVMIREHGYAPAMEKNHWPLQRTATGQQADTTFSGQKEDFFSISTPDALRQRVDNNAPVQITDIMNVLMDEITRASTVNGLYAPVREFSKVWNAKTDDGFDSLRDIVGKNMGKRTVESVESLLTSLSGGMQNEADSTWQVDLINKISSNYIKSIFAGNIRVTLTQVASIASSFTKLDTPSMLEGSILSLWKGNVFSMKDPPEWFKQSYQGLLRKNDNGNGVALGNTQKVTAIGGRPNNIFTKLSDAINKLIFIKGTDLATVSATGWMSQVYVRNHWNETHPDNPWVDGKDGTATTPEFFEAVANKWNEVIEDTQPATTPMQTPAAARNKDSLQKVTTSFMTQRRQNFNELYSSERKWRQYESDFKHNKNGVNDDDVADARKGFAKAVVSYITQSALVSVFQIAADMLLRNTDNYEDDETGEITAESFTKQAGKTFAGNIIGSILFGNYIGSFVNYGAMNVLGTDQLNTFVESFNDIVDTIKEKKTPTAKQTLTFAKAFGALCGVPVTNGYKIVSGITGWKDAIENGINTGEWDFKSLMDNGNATTAQQLNRFFEYVDTEANIANGTANANKAENAIDALIAAYQSKNPDKDAYAKDNYLANVILGRAEKEFKENPDFTADDAANILNNYTDTWGEDAADTVDKWQYYFATMDLAKQAAEAEGKEWDGDGFDYSNMENDVVDGKMSTDDAVYYMTTFGNETQEDAEATVLKWQWEIDNPGYKYDQLSYYYQNNYSDVASEESKLSRTEVMDALMNYGGKSYDEATDFVAAIDYYGHTGREWSNLADDYYRGEIDEKTLANYLKDYKYFDYEPEDDDDAKTAAEKAASRASVYTWNKYIKDNNLSEDYLLSLSDNSEKHIAKYNTYGKKNGIDLVTYEKAYDFYTNARSDYDANGKTTTSKATKVANNINSLNLTAKQKDALFLSFGYTKGAASHMACPWYKNLY